jgi:hypothetical protein
MPAQLLDDHYTPLTALIDVLNGIVRKNLDQEVSDQKGVLEAIHTNLISIAGRKPPLKEKMKEIERNIQFHTKNLEILDSNFSSISSESFLNKIIHEFNIEIDQYLKDAPEILRIAYTLESIKAKNEDTFKVRMSYAFENSFIKFQRIGRATANFFRRLFKKTKKSSGDGILKVHFKKVVQGFLLPEYISEIGEIAKETQRELIEHYMSLNNLEYAFIQNDYSFQGESFPKFEFNGIAARDAIPSGFFGEHRNEFEAHIQRTGMLLSMNLWHTMGSRLDFNKANEYLVKMNKSWQSTFFAFFEDWRFREQLFAYMQSVQSAHLNTASISSERVNKSLFPEVKKQLVYTTELMERLPDPDTSGMESVRKFFVSELYRLKKEKLSEEQKNSLLQATEDIPKILQKLENVVTEKLDIFPEKVGVVGHPKYITGIKSSEIYYFSPGEFIEYECLGNFSKKLALFRSDLEENLKLIINEFSEYNQILDFYLDSTISLTEKTGMTESEVISFFREGLQRLLKISNRIAEFMKVLQTEKLNEVSDMVKVYLQEVADLDDNDNIINIYARLIKSKALAESRTSRKKLVDYSKKTYSRASTSVSRKSRWIRTAYSDLKKRLWLDNTSKTISSDISNYLTNIQQRVYKLPVIYQHLFENSPLREFNLFLSREGEINKLDAAYNDWLKDNFAASLVTGENGSGKSSLLYYYSKTLKSNYLILSFLVSRFYYTEDDYYDFISELFKNPDLRSDEAIATYITSFKERRIIIIDGLERLFVRKVNGFGCLQKLLSLIVSTNHKVFWICSVSKYALDYLNKTIALSEYFDYNINIDSLDSKQIQDIVLKRNRLSGYEVTYLMGEPAGDKAKTKKMDQDELEEKFFAELNQFAHSNISLSLNYWLQSIHSIQDDCIEIGNFIAPDFGFLENISAEKAYTLLVIVIHGKITVEQHALIFSQKMERSFKVLTILKEDSILVKQGEYFILNGILFRHVVRVLKNRNLIH